MSTSSRPDANPSESATSSGSGPRGGAPRRKPWLRRLVWAAGVLVVLTVAGWFVVTSGAFVKGVIVPRVGQALHADLAVTDASVAPFSSVVLKGLTLRTTGTEPVLAADEVRLRYRLMDILGGVLRVDEVALVRPRVVVEMRADGTSNLDPLTRGGGEQSTGAGRPSPAPAPGSSAPPQVEIASVIVEDARVRWHREAGSGETNDLTVEAFNLRLGNVRNGQVAKLAIDGRTRWQQAKREGGTTRAGSADATLKLDLNLGLTPALGLGQLTGQGAVTVGAAGGELGALSGVSLGLDCDVTPAEVRGVVLRALRGTSAVGEVRLAGPFSLERREGPLVVGITNVNLTDWKMFAADLDPTGRLATEARIVVAEAGRRVGFEADVRLDELGALVGTNRYAGLGLSLVASGQLTNAAAAEVGLTSARLGLTHRRQPFGEIIVSGTAKGGPDTVASLAVAGDIDVARALAAALPVPSSDLTVTGGRLGWQLRLAKQGATSGVAGRLAVDRLNGRVNGIDLRDFGVGTRIDVEVAGNQTVALREMTVELAGTERARTNALTLSGNLDLSRSNAVSGALALRADTLDLTPYYDLVAGGSASTGATAPSTPPAASPGTRGDGTEPGAGTGSEPGPLRLPVGLVQAEARIGRLWLREVAASNLVATVRVEPERVTVRPMGLVMNGASLEGDVDLGLGVPGWKYAVRFAAAGLPVEPLANSFSPEYRGRAKGDVWADVKLDGAGVTMPSLRRHLAGRLALSFTNADIQLVSPRVKGFLTPVAAALRAPGLLNSPLRWAGFDLSVLTGRVDVAQLALVSPVFAAVTSGGLTLADDVGASGLRQWPMSFSLDRALADRLKLAPKGTPTNVALVTLPAFLKVAGTVSSPKPDIDYQSLAGAALLQYGEKLAGGDERTGALLKGLGGLLSGQRSPAPGAEAGAGAGAVTVVTTNAAGVVTTNSVPATNAPTTNANPVGTILDLLNRRPR